MFLKANRIARRLGGIALAAALCNMIGSHGDHGLVAIVAAYADRGPAAPVVAADGTVDDSAVGWTWMGLSPIQDDQLHGGTAHAGGVEACADYTFHGTGVEVFAMAGPSVVVDGRSHKLGTLKISIDGKPQASFLLRRPTVEYGVSAGKITGLPDGNHVLELTADGGWITVDDIQVIRTPAPADSAAQLDFGSGFTEASSLRLNGNAKIEFNALVLTDGQANQLSSAFSANPLSMRSFKSSFRIQFLNAVADGMVFCLQSSSPSALGLGESAMGFGGITRSAAIKFDIYDNSGEGTDSTGLFLNGVPPTTPSIDLSHTGIQFRSGHPIDVVVSYDGVELTVHETDTVTGGSANQTYPIDLPAVIGDKAYAGFTGSSGGQVATQVVLSWTFASQP